MTIILARGPPASFPLLEANMTVQVKGESRRNKESCSRAAKEKKIDLQGSLRVSERKPRQRLGTREERGLAPPGSPGMLL